MTADREGMEAFWMENGGGARKLKGIGAYLLKALKFYELKNESLTRLIFVVILFISFAGFFVPNNKYLLVAANFLVVTVTYLASTVYLAAYIKDLKGEDYTPKACIRLVAGSTFRIIGSSIAYLAAIALTLGFMILPELAGMLLLFLIVPLLILYVTYLFSTCYVVDKRYGIAGAFKSSRKTTSGHKGAVFMTILLFNFIAAIPVTFIWLAVAGSNNILMVNFLISFLGAVLNLMQQRLTALMYMDLEYGYEKPSSF